MDRQGSPACGLVSQQRSRARTHEPMDYLRETMCSRTLAGRLTHDAACDKEKRE
jgi:hypothetical protein